MKKLLLSAAFVLAAFVGANAQTKVYNITEIYGEAVAAADLVSKDGLIIVGNDKCKITANNQSSEGVVYKYRLQTGGKITPKAGVLPSTAAFGIPVDGAGTIKLVALTGSNGSSRPLSWSHQDASGTITEGDMTDASGNQIAPGDTPTDKVEIDGVEYNNVTPITWDWTGAAGTLYFYSRTGANNFYMVSFTPANATAINTVAAEQEVVATEYYNINGVRTNATTSGIYIKRDVLKDGSVKVTKTVVR